VNPKISKGPKYGVTINARTLVQMVRLLHDGDVSKADIMEKLGICSRTVTIWMRLMGSDDPNMPHRLVYISGWRKAARGNPAALWSYGFEMPDAEKPKPMSAAEYTERYRAKKRGHLMLVVGG
jgi:hypothetical protein